MSVKRTAQQAASNWQTGFSGAGTKYQQGVSAVTTAPGQLAAAAAPKWQAGVTSADALNKYKTKVGNVTLESWKNSALTTGVARLSQGAAKGAPKMQTFMTNFIPFLTNVVQKIDSMPSLTYEDRKARAIALMDGNHGYKAPAA